MAVPASRLSRLADKAREHADEIEAVALNTTGPAIKTAPATQKDDAFDVWSHTVAGAEGASTERPADAWKAAAESPSREWARADSDAVGASIEQQADDALKKFQLLTGQRAPEPGEEAVDGFLGGLGTTFDILTSLEQMISAPLAMLPFPAFPALRVMDMDIGLPHGHSHPPNLVLPAPMVFLPSTGPIIPIPFLSGATRTLINGLPAGRCGDMGLGVWCGGYFPMYEVFLGSSSVWIEGARAGRLLVDVTRHCIFSAPGPKDPPLGPMVGMTITASPNVLIGGVPMPSLLDLAMGKAIEGLFKGVGKAVKRAKAARAASKASKAGDEAGELATVVQRAGRGPGAGKLGRPAQESYWRRALHAAGGDVAEAVRRRAQARALVDLLIDKGKINLEHWANLEHLVREDLYLIASTRAGRDVLVAIGASPHKTRIRPSFTQGVLQKDRFGQPYIYYGPTAFPAGHGADFKIRPDGSAGPGTGTHVYYDPENSVGPNSPPDTALIHELGHAAHNAQGVCLRDRTAEVANQPHMTPAQRAEVRPDDMALNDRWTDGDEQVVIGYENSHRQQSGLPVRHGHKDWEGLGGSDRDHYTPSGSKTAEIPFYPEILGFGK